jgi:hypothetical protein
LISVSPFLPEQVIRHLGHPWASVLW